MLIVVNIKRILHIFNNNTINCIEPKSLDTKLRCALILVRQYLSNPMLFNVPLLVSHCFHSDISRIPNKNNIMCGLTSTVQTTPFLKSCKKHSF